MDNHSWSEQDSFYRQLRWANTVLHMAPGEKWYLPAWSLPFSEDHFHHLKPFMRKTMFLNLGHRSFAQGFYKVLNYPFISRIIWNKHILIISLPRPISVTAYAVVFTVCFGAHCHIGTSSDTTFMEMVKKDQRGGPKRGAKLCPSIMPNKYFPIVLREKSGEKTESSYNRQ